MPTMSDETTRDFTSNASHMVQEATDQRTPHRAGGDLRTLVGTVEHDLITSNATASTFRADSPPAYHLMCDRVIISYQAPWDEGAVRTAAAVKNEREP